MEVVVIQQSKNLPSLDPSIAGDSCSLREGSSSTEATSLKDNSSVAMDLLFLPVHMTGATPVETQQTDAVCRVEVVALVLTKNIFGFLTTLSFVDLGENKKNEQQEGMKTYAATAKRTERRMVALIFNTISTLDKNCLCLSP